MIAQPTLPSSPRDHDLPPRWDDCDVTWRPWHALPHSTLVFHRPQPEACPRCGSLAVPVTCRGSIWLPTSVRVIGARHGRPLGGTLRAFRCPDCRHDQVTDHDGRVWDLDDSDYTDVGSKP